MHDVVFENGGAAEGAQDANGQNGNGDGSGNGEASAQSYVNGDGAEEQTEERAENYRAERKFFNSFFSGDERPEFAWVVQWNSTDVRSKKASRVQTKLAACGIMPHERRVGKQILDGAVFLAKRERRNQEFKTEWD